MIHICRSILKMNYNLHKQIIKKETEIVLVKEEPYFNNSSGMDIETEVNSFIKDEASIEEKNDKCEIVEDFIKDFNDVSEYLDQEMETPSTPEGNEGLNIFSSLENIGEANSISLETAKKNKVSSNKRKEKRQRGLEYSTRKGIVVKEKTYKFFDCGNCRYNCKANISDERRRQIHNAFWKSANWQVQTNYILQNVKTESPRRRTCKGTNKSRIQFTRKYFIDHKRVCQKVFLVTLSINHMRVDYCLKNKRIMGGLCSPDKRGLTNNANKTPCFKIERLKKFLNEMPKYQSHSSNSPCLYFHPDIITQKKLYDLYKEKMEEEEEHQYVSRFVFGKFLSQLNISIYIPKSDTCDKCDNLNIKIKTAFSDEDKEKFKEDLRKHLGNAEAGRRKLEYVDAEVRNDPSTMSFTFDLERIQPLPHINTNKVFYKQQLLLYNFGINRRADNQAFMSIWLESEGKGGSQEICSAILAFLKEQNLENIKCIKTFSDCCGEQNCNKYILSFMMWCCQKFDFNEWQHSFLESGHSYLPDNSDFALIEKKKKKTHYIFSKADWIQLISEANSKSPFNIIDMAGNFKMIESLAEQRNFKNIDDNGNKFNWLMLKWFSVQKNSDLVKYKYCYTEDLDNTISFPLKNGQSILENLYAADTNNMKISKKKYNDLQDLLPFILPVHHDFYKNLPHEIS